MQKRIACIGYTEEIQKQNTKTGITMEIIGANRF
jgi:hypothetical protein